MAERQVYVWCPVAQAYRHVYVTVSQDKAVPGHGRRLVKSAALGGGGKQGKLNPRGGVPR